VRALYWDGYRLRLDSDYPTPQADDRTAIVRIRLAGICSTDLQIFQGYMGFQGVPGHEFVAEVHEGPSHLQGARVVGEINFACGHCLTCTRGLGRHCPKRQVMGILGADGCFAEYLAVPVQNLHPIPDSISDEAAVFTEPLAAAFEILEQVHLKPTDTVVVLGDGKLGLLCAQVLQHSGAQVCVVGKHQSKLHHLQKLGLRTALLADWQSIPTDVVIDVSGSTAGLQLAMETVRPRGMLVLKSTVAANYTLSLAPLVINEVTVIGSRCGPFQPALRALAQQHITVTPFIDHIYPLAAGSDAVAHAKRPGTLKILLRNS
jgi:threonine dehydrogenase-like Zn-dependent dehydrogenase